MAVKSFNYLLRKQWLVGVLTTSWGFCTNKNHKLSFLYFWYSSKQLLWKYCFVIMRCVVQVRVQPDDLLRWSEVWRTERGQRHRGSSDWRRSRDRDSDPGHLQRHQESSVRHACPLPSSSRTQRGHNWREKRQRPFIIPSFQAPYPL